MSGDDGRIPFTMYAKRQPSLGGRDIVRVELEDGEPLTAAYTDVAGERGIPIPPPPPVKVTLSIELDEADADDILGWSIPEVPTSPTERIDRAVYESAVAARAWVAANPEGEQP